MLLSSAEPDNEEGCGNQLHHSHSLDLAQVRQF